MRAASGRRASRPRLPLAASIDALCAPWARKDSPGCAVAVVEDGEILHLGGYGMADLERGVPLTPGSRLEVGSLAKQFTAMCVALLAQQGKLALDDDLRVYLPELRHDARITLRHLVHHTSGLRDYLDLLALAGRRQASTGEVLALLQRQRGLNFPPGEEYQYCNSGYVLLAAVVARAAGCSFAEYAEAAIFRPLGMSRTGFAEGGRQDGGNLALAYSPLERGGLAVNAAGINLPGDGALLTTAEDLSCWERNFFDNRLGAGGSDLGRQLAAPGKLNSGKDIGYAFGLFLGKLGKHRILYHGGTFAAYHAELVRCPRRKLSVLCLANLATVDAEGLARRIAALCLGERADRPRAPARLPAASPPAEQLAEWSGLFKQSAGGRVWWLAAEDGKLSASSGPLHYVLAPIAADRMGAQGPRSLTLTRESHDDGRVTRLVLEEKGETPVLLERVRQHAPVPGELNEYAGTYACDELEVAHEVRHEQGRLWVQMREIPFPLPLAPMNRDEFTTQGVTVRFLRGPSRRISGFVISSPRVRELRFSGPRPAAPPTGRIRSGRARA